MNLLNKVSNKIFLTLIIILFFLKIIFFFCIKSEILVLNFGGGSDADYYHDYAMGYTDYAVSIWPEILLYLKNKGLYYREIISYILFFINIVIIPLIFSYIVGDSFSKNQKNFLVSSLIILIYPTLYFYSFDIYRDVFMVLAFLISCFSFKFFLLERNILIKFFLLLAVFFMGIFLYKLRPYLGVAFLTSIFLYKIKINKRNYKIFIFLYLVLLFIFNYFGFLNKLTDYRSGFLENDGGTNLGLDFSNPIMFIPNFILSILGQIFGLYIVNPAAFILFIVETVPFVWMLIYVLRNLNKLDNFLRFILIFFVLYSSIWLIGNDNLGTAVRLRIFSYFSIYICFFYMLNKKFNMVIK